VTKNGSDGKYFFRTSCRSIYSWFTEGFDTLDLKEAKALLDEQNARQPIFKPRRLYRSA
jgi:hypothetical protein